MSKISASLLRDLRGQPCLYAARSRDKQWIKFGFSKHITDRLAAIDQDYLRCAPFTPLGVCLSSWRAEQQLHRALRPIKSWFSREIYPSYSGIVQLAEIITETEVFEPFGVDDYCDLRKWSRQVARKVRRVAA